MSNNKDSFCPTFILGALFGAVIALLYAPRTGKETREILKDSFEDYSEEGKKIYKEKSEQLEEAYQSGKKAAEEKVSDYKKKFGEVKDKVSEKVKEMKKEEDVEDLPEEK